MSTTAANLVDYVMPKEALRQSLRAHRRKLTRHGREPSPHYADGDHASPGSMSLRRRSSRAHSADAIRVVLPLRELPAYPRAIGCVDGRSESGLPGHRWGGP